MLNGMILSEIDICNGPIKFAYFVKPCSKVKSELLHRVRLGTSIGGPPDCEGWSESMLTLVPTKYTITSHRDNTLQFIVSVTEWI